MKQNAEHLQRIQKVQAGEVITLFNRDGQPVEVTVAPPCDTPDNGYWLCVTHHTDPNRPAAYRNNFEKDTHIARGRHRLVWMCFVHGTAEQA